MLCRKCSKEIPDDSLFCNHCGTKQTVSRAPKKRGNGQGTVCKLKSGKWQAIVTLGYVVDANGKRHRKKRTKVFAKKSDAIASLITLKEAVRPLDMSIADLHAQYLQTDDYKNLSLSLRSRYKIAWRRLEPISYKGIASLTVSDIESHFKTAASSYDMVHEMQSLLSHLYRIAIKQEIVQVNKAQSAENPYPHNKPKRSVWSESEVNAFWADLPDHPFTAYILIACYAGLRYGELASIRLSNIHLDENYMVGGIKTEAGTDRQIPIHTRIKPLIATLILQNKTKLLEIPEQRFYTMYTETLKRLDLTPLPFHTCRHYFFSRLTAAGVQGGLIAEVGGHASYMTTLKNYVRISIEDKVDAVNKI